MLVCPGSGLVRGQWVCLGLLGEGMSGVCLLSLYVVVFDLAEARCRSLGRIAGLSWEMWITCCGFIWWEVVNNYFWLNNQTWEIKAVTVWCQKS
jgi:hypothetical protein